MGLMGQFLLRSIVINTHDVMNLFDALAVLTVGRRAEGSSFKLRVHFTIHNSFNTIIESKKESKEDSIWVKQCWLTAPMCVTANLHLIVCI